VTSGSKLRVLLLIKCLGQGGAERILVDLAANSDRDAFEYEVAYVLASEDGLAGEMAATGTPVHRLGARGDWDMRWLAELRHVVVGGRFDVVHAHLPYSAALGRFVTWTVPSSRRPGYVYTEHSIWGKTTPPVRFLNAAGIRRDDALVAVSESVRDALPEGLRHRARVIVHGVDLSQAADLVARRSEIRREVRCDLALDEGSCIVLTVANLRSEKGYDVLLEAASSALGRGLEATFVSAGRGPLTEQLKQAHGEMGLGDSFRFLGPRDDVLRLMVASDIFVLPSRQEGLPVTLMEATSVGLPIVASAVGEIPKMITDGQDGLLVVPGDPSMLAGAVEKLVRDPALRASMGTASMRLRERFDVSRSARELEQLYREIVSRRN
jgi:L-malate glycosyltransferase